MRRTLTILLFSITVGLLAGRSAPAIYEFEMTRIDGTPQALAEFRGKVILMVNVASQCGFTSQYEGLEALYERYKDRGLVVLGFPSNDFGAQEPGSNAEIAEYCRAAWGIRFPMFEKIRVRGDEKHPLYAYLTNLPAPIGGEVQWNFQKFLVDRDGLVVEKISPGTRPESAALVARIEALLEQTES